MNLSLGTRLAIGAAIILTTQIGAGVAYLMQIESNQVLERSLNAQRRALASSIREAEANLTALSQPVLELALDPRVRQAVNQHFAPSHQLESVVNRFLDASGDRFHRVLVVNLAGEGIIDAHSQLGASPEVGVNHTLSPWFTGAALAGSMRATGGPVSLTTAEDTQGRVVLRNAIFLYDDDGIGVGAMMVETPLAAVLGTSASPSQGQRFVLDHLGNMLVNYPGDGTPPIVQPAGATPQATLHRINGTWHIISQGSIRPPAQAALRWQVIDVIPKHQATAVFASSSQPLWIGGLTGATISIFLVVIFSRRLVKPLQQLSAEAKQAGEALPSQGTVTIIDNAGPEIHAMSHAFHHMHQRISDSYALIEQQVEELESSQNQLIQREEDLATTLESLSEALITLDLGGVIDRFNPAAEALFGIPAVDAVGARIDEIVHLGPGVDAGQVDEDPLEAIQSDQGRGSLRLISDAHPEPIWVAARAAPIRDRYGQIRGTVLVLSDVSQQRSLQTQLIQAQKMEAIGRLAGGIAHDFNNLLASMLGFAERLSLRLTDPDQRRMLSHIMQAGSRARDLIDQLLTFARQGKRQHTLVNLASVARHACELLRHTGRGTQQITVDLDEASWIKGDASQLEHAILNLGINAFDAMQARPDGVLTLTISHLERDISGRIADQESGIVLLEVRDQGEGMDEATIDRACDPFFTTKEQGKGTGLGLASVYGCVEQHGGWIDITSVPQEGTTIILAFPAQPPPCEHQPTPETQHIPQPTQVLMVSSQAETITSFTQACKDCSFHCQVCDDPANAVSAFDQLRPQVVVLDCTGAADDRQEVMSFLLGDQCSAVVVILVDAQASQETISQWYNQGVYAVVKESLLTEELQIILEQSLEQYRGKFPNGGQGSG